MRLHRLEVTAFGPFADTVEVDFDVLSDAGLFLLCGPTGAGKTSVLDAVCFALYGDVPGDRSSAKRLRCDTAPEGVAPRVLLETTLTGRRFRLTRSPHWSRPKRRGSGMTTQQASVLIEERLDGQWQTLSNRLDETGHLMTELLGMNMPQFCQVAMLPQGRFQMFLRARSEDRHKVLQQLFSTHRFEDIEKWLRERSRQLHRDSQTHHREVAATVSRILEAGGVELPDQWLLDDLTRVAEAGELAAWSAERVQHSTESASEAAEHAQAAAEAERLARQALDEGRRVVSLHDRRKTATDQLERLAHYADQQEARRRTVREARKAEPVVPLRRLAVATSQQRDRAAETALSCSVAAAYRLGLAEVSPDDLVKAARTARSTITHAEVLRPREAEQTALQKAVEEGRLVLEQLSADEVQLNGRLATLPAEIEALTIRVQGSRAAAESLVVADKARAQLTTRLDAQGRLEAVRAELDLARTALASGLGHCQLLREAWLDLREARLQGMAAEIASSLAVGACCPVCGSADHPTKAVPSPGAPDAAAEKAARKRHEDAEVNRVALESRVHELTRLEVRLTHESGDQPREVIERALLDAEREAAALTEACAGLAGLEQALIEADSAGDRCRDELNDKRVYAATTASQVAADEAALARGRAEVDAALTGTGVSCLTELIRVQTEDLCCFDEAAKAVADHAAAVATAAEAQSALDEWLASNGYAHPAEAEDALLGTDLAEAERLLVAHDEQVAASRAVLEDPGVAAVADLPWPDLAELAQQHHEAAEQQSAATTRHRVATARASRLGGLHTTLVGQLDAWAPLRPAYAVASELAAFVEGKSLDNELKMRLSAYVLAWRLTQVVSAANERLLRMSDQRYTLEHSGQRGAGETRGGLSLLVRDEWSGESRDPATLSGGETFVVSLALALGLADVVTQEAGGADLDTLFVDEGFGALDADTLDDVMDTLDTLRDGGRVVGVVSHVAELRSRIPVRLQVAKQRLGSSITLEQACE